MDGRRILESETTAWVIGGGAVVAVAFMALHLFGWLGFAMVGFFGALITVRQSLFGDHAVIDADHGSGAIPMLRAQDRTRTQDTTADGAPGDQAEKTRRRRLLNAVAGAFLAMALLGVFIHLLRTGA